MHFTVNSLHFTVILGDSVLIMVISMHFTVNSVHFTVISMHFTVNSLHFTVISMHFKVIPGDSVLIHGQIQAFNVQYP
ncbi:hypothetical protein PJP07_30180, partial [Mycobacterium kansasii]